MVKTTGKLLPEAKPRALSLWFMAFLFSPEANILFFLIPFAKSNIFVKTRERKDLFSAGV